MFRSRPEHPVHTLYLFAGTLAALSFALLLVVSCGASPSATTPQALPTAIAVTSPTLAPPTVPATQAAQPATATSTTQPAAPTPTVLPATASPAPTIAPAGDLSRLPIGVRVYQAGVVDSFIRPGDIVGSALKNARAADALSSLPQEDRMLMFPTIVGLTSTLDSLTMPISYIGYDLEQSGASPEEVQDPVQAVKTAQQIAHSRGLQLVIGPTRYFVDKYGPQMAPYTDVFIPQAKYYQANLSPAQYEQTLRALFTSLKQANPQVKIMLDISPSPKTTQKTPAEMLQSVQSVLDLIDGVWITYGPTETQQLLEFVKLLGR